MRWQRSLVTQQALLFLLAGFNGWLLWHNYDLSTRFDALLHGAQVIYDQAADRCLQRGALAGPWRQ